GRSLKLKSIAARARPPQGSVCTGCFLWETRPRGDAGRRPAGSSKGHQCMRCAERTLQEAVRRSGSSMARRDLYPQLTNRYPALTLADTPNPYSGASRSGRLARLESPMPLTRKHLLSLVVLAAVVAAGWLGYRQLYATTPGAG